MKRLPPFYGQSIRIQRLSWFVLAFLITVLTTVILFFLRELVNPSIIALLFLIPVGISAAFWGLWPALFTALMAFLSINYFFIQPYYSLLVHQPLDLIELMVFFGVAFGISQIMGRMRESLAAATAREREASRLYELSLKLSGLNDQQSIMQGIARHTLETIQADHVQIILQSDQGLAPELFEASEPSVNSIRSSPVTAIVPIQGARQLLGEMRVWRSSAPLETAEERLLHAFAAQGVLALERARLVQADTRARVLEESDRMKSSLLSSVSHEFRTPLATIKASVTSLRSDTVPWDSEARHELLAAIDEEADHLNQLVGNLLSMSRIETGSLKPECKWNMLSDIASGPINRARATFTSHTIVVDIPDDLPLVFVDDIQIEQVFSNLLSNSMKYSPEQTPIHVIARQKDERTMWIQVRNQGPHVSEEDLERIFDKFHRVTSADRITGTGLGLSICKGIVEAHHGKIWAENLPDGFSIHFTLPLTWEGVALKLPLE